MKSIGQFFLYSFFTAIGTAALSALINLVISLVRMIPSRKFYWDPFIFKAQFYVYFFIGIILVISNLFFEKNKP